MRVTASKLSFDCPCVNEIPRASNQYATVIRLSRRGGVVKKVKIEEKAAASV
jgi:hypothetical protein